MAKALATATGVRYAELLKQYTESKGATFTDALAMAVPQLSGDSQKRVREALAERMSSFPVATIKKRLHDPNPELRRAAALAVYMSEEAGAMDLVPELFDALNDTEDLVVRGAHLALRYISKFKKDEQDFGPAPGAAAAQRAKAIADWKAWWEKKK